jgi:phosphatidylethanolamine/phosphatidyl-N-methylethanolamine N-methyltransferase
MAKRRGVGTGIRRLQRSVGKVLAPERMRFLSVPEAECELVLPARKPSISRLWHKTRHSAPALFVREVLANPRVMGAACPSSRQLAMSMATLLPHRFDGQVVELGAGTGVVTAALLRRGIRPQQLTVVERSPLLAAHLRKRFPHLQVVEGDAVHLSAMLERFKTRAAAVVSSLPMRSLPAATVEAIMDQIDAVLGPDGLFIQFTYALRALPCHLPRRFKQVRSRIIWRNLPPARVEMFKTGLR